MSAKKFIKTLFSQLSQDATEVPSQEELSVSFKQAVDNLPKGKLRKSLRSDFDKHLETLHRKLSKKIKTTLPTPFTADSDEGLSELSTLDARVVPAESSPKRQRLIYSLFGKIVPPEFDKHRDLTREEKQQILSLYISEVLKRQEVEDETILALLHKLEEISEPPTSDEDSKSKFKWLQRMNTLFKLSTGHDGRTLVQVLKILFREITSDVENIVEKEKCIRAGRMAEILHQYLTCVHMRKSSCKLQADDEKAYADLMSAVLSFYVDLCLVHSSKVMKKKQEGRQLCGFVSYLLKDHPESILEVLLQLYAGMEDSKDIILPLVKHSLSTTPVGNSHYLKYVLVAKAMTQKLGQDEMIDYILKTKALRCSSGFLDWLQEVCPDAVEEMPVNDKKFKGRNVTKFLLEEADDNLTMLLMDSLRNTDQNLEPTCEADDLQKVVELLTDTDQGPSADLFFIDKGGAASVSQEKKATEDMAEDPKYESLVLKTLKEIEAVVDSSDTEPFKIDPNLISDDISDKEFFTSGIVSIKSLQPLVEDTEDETGVSAAVGSNIQEKNEEFKEENDQSETESVLLLTETEDDNDNLANSKSKTSESTDEKLQVKSPEKALQQVGSKMERSSSRLKSVVVKPSKKEDKLKENSKRLVSETDQSASETEYNPSESTLECTDHSAVSTEAVSLTETAASEISESEVSRSEVFSSEGEITVVHLGNSRKLIAESETDNDTVTDSLYDGKHSKDKHHHRSSQKETTKQKKKETGNQDDVTAENKVAKISEKKRHSKGSNNSVNSENTSPKEITPGKHKGKQRHSRPSNGSIDSQSTTLEGSELDKTERYVDGLPYKSPYKGIKTPNKSNEGDENELKKKRKGSKSSEKKKRKSAATDEATASMKKSIEEKFVVKALKKTPRKSSQDNNSALIKSSEKENDINHRSATKSPGTKSADKDLSVDQKEKSCSKAAAVEMEHVANLESDFENEIAVIEDNTDSHMLDSHAEDSTTPKKKTGRLTPQKMFEILNDVKHMTTVSDGEKDSDSKYTKNESCDEKESDLCIEIASESEDNRDIENELKEIFSDSKSPQGLHTTENLGECTHKLRSSVINKSTEPKQATSSLQKVSDSVFKLSENSEVGSDKNESSVSVIDLVSEFEEQEDNDDKDKILERQNSLSQIENTEILDMSPRRRSPRKSSLNDKSSVRSPAKQSPANDKKHDLGLLKERNSPESDNLDIVSPSSKKKSLNLRKVLSPEGDRCDETRRDDKTGSGSDVEIVQNADKSVARQKSPEKFRSADKVLTPKQKPPKSPPARIDGSHNNDTNRTDKSVVETSPDDKKYNLRSPKVRNSSSGVDDNHDTIITQSPNRKSLVSTEKHSHSPTQKSPKIPAPSLEDGEKIDKTCSKELGIESPASSKKYNLRSPDIGDKSDVVIPSSHRKSLNSLKTGSLEEKESEKSKDIQSDSDIDIVPNLSEHLKSPHVPVISNDKANKKETRRSVRCKQSVSYIESESDVSRPSPRKKSRSSSDQDHDIFDFHSETDQSDREEVKLRKSVHKAKADEQEPDKLESKRKVSRRSVLTVSQSETAAVLEKAEAERLASVTGRHSSTDQKEQVKEHSRTPSKSPTKIESPKNKAAKPKESKSSKLTSPKEKATNTGKEKELRPKRKSVAYTGLKPEDLEQELLEENKSPPRRRSERKVSASTSKKPVQKKIEEVRKSSRKRRLSSELSKSESESIIDDTDDSEISFPTSKKTKDSKPAARTSKRLSTQSGTKKDETSSSPKGVTKQRYSLRKK